MANSPGEAGKIVSINVSREKGVRKAPVGEALLIAGRGFQGDAHAGDWHRQVSLLAVESIAKMLVAGLDVGPGDFAENITTSGMDLVRLPVGTVLRVGNGIRLEVTQIGKVCHGGCSIFELAGDCVMPREGIFARVLAGGTIKSGDLVAIERPGMVGEHA